MAITKPYRHCYKSKDRQGRDRWLLRVPGRKAKTIKGRYGTPEFAANYRAAMEGSEAVEKKGLSIPRRGTIAALSRTYLGSAAFVELSSATQRARRHLIEQFVSEHGDKDVAGLEQRHVKAIIEAKRATPGSARNLLTMLRVLMALAIEEGVRADDPTVGIKRPKLRGDGWHTWSEDEIAQYEAKHPIGSQARLGFALALCTGQRSADLIRMGRQHVRNGVVSVQQQKTGTSLAIPLHPSLTAIIDATRSDHLTFLVTHHGKPYRSANSFGHRIRLWAREAGLTGCPLHGLRKACCRRLAEAGCTPSEIKAISGHKTLSEVERYTRAADQKLMAGRAIARTESYTRPDPILHTEKKA